jgi:hypothetical protein
MKTKYRFLILLTIIIIAHSACSLAADLTESTTDNSESSTNRGERNIGLNMFASQHDWVKDRMFADVMKSSREWKEAGNYGNGDILDESDLDDNGWPLTDAESIIWSNTNMNGRYYFELECDVEPTVSFGYTAGATKENISYSNGIYSCEVVVEKSEGTTLLLIITGTENGFKNVKMMRPTEPGSSDWYSKDTKFTDQSKELVDNANVIRLMWPVDAWNGPWQVEWDDRVQPDYCSFNRGESDPDVYWGGYGIAWEYAIDFCNETGKDAWIVLPVGGNDDYITELATLWKNNYTVNGGKIYWEYSNEATWAYSVHTGISNWLREQGEAEYQLGGPVTYDGVSNENVLGVRWHAKRAVEMSLIWRDVWGDDEMMETIRPVLSGHAKYNDQNQWGLDFIYQYFGNKSGDYVSDPHGVDYFFYGTGGDFYSGDDPDGADTINLVVDGSEQTVSGSEIELYEVYAESEAAMAKSYGLERCAYEGTIWTTEEDYDLSRIEDAMIEYLELWDKYDGDLLCYYVSSGGEDNGKALGFTFDGLDLDTPKYRALEYITENNKSSITGGTLAPCSIDGANFSTNYVPWQRPLPLSMETTGSTQLSSYYKYVGYLVRTESSATWGIQIDFTTYSNIDIEITVNGETIYRGDIEGVGDETSEVYPVDLESGLHSVAVRAYADSNDYFELNSVIVMEM